MPGCLYLDRYWAVWVLYLFVNQVVTLTNLLYLFNQSVLSTWPKRQDKKFEYHEKEKSFQDKIKNIFITLEGLSVKQIKQTLFGRWECTTLTRCLKETFNFGDIFWNLTITCNLKTFVLWNKLYILIKKKPKPCVHLSFIQTHSKISNSYFSQNLVFLKICFAADGLSVSSMYFHQSNLFQ